MSQIAWVNTPYGWVTSVPGRGWILESDYYNLLRYPVTYQWDLAQNQQHPFHHHHRRHQSLNDPLLFPLRSFFNQHGQKLDFKIQSKWPHVLITLCFGLSQLSFALWFLAVCTRNMENEKTKCMPTIITTNKHPSDCGIRRRHCHAEYASVRREAPHRDRIPRLLGDCGTLVAPNKRKSVPQCAIL